MDTLQIECKRSGSRFKISARWRGEFVYCDTLDPSSAARRKQFADRLHEKVPQADPEVIGAKLLKIAASVSAASESPSDRDVELDVSRIVRPEQFFNREVSGLAVPVACEVGGKPAARWMQYLRWADGRRECRALSAEIELSDEEQLWLHPTPGQPSLPIVLEWSRTSRQAWLQGSDTPDPADLFKRVCERIAYFIDLPEGVAAPTTATLALWVFLSYVYQAWDSVPYLYIGGPLASGKSRVFEVLARLVFRPFVSSNLTAPALFRTLHDRGGVALLDEAERFRQLTPETGEILSMLLAGYKRGGQAVRLEPAGDSFKMVAFDVYGPKALACIAGLPPTLASRCITILMFRAGPSSRKPQQRIDEDRAGWQLLRDDLHALALEHGPTWLKLASRSDVCPQGISGRGYELWQPLLALATWVQSYGAKRLLPLMQQHALAIIDAAILEQIPEADAIVLEILTAAIQLGQPPTPGEILAKAKERAPSLFDRCQAQTVSRKLKTYGIDTPRKSNGIRRYRDVTIESLHRIQRNYGIDLGLENSATTPISSTLLDPGDPQESSESSESRVARVGEGQ